MKKYRILQIGESFIPQWRCLFLFWYDFEYNHASRHEFQTIEDARSFFKRFFKRTAPIIKHYDIIGDDGCDTEEHY